MNGDYGQRTRTGKVLSLTWLLIRVGWGAFWLCVIIFAIVSSLSELSARSQTKKLLKLAKESAEHDYMDALKEGQWASASTAEVAKDSSKRVAIESRIAMIQWLDNGLESLNISGDALGYQVQDLLQKLQETGEDYIIHAESPATIRSNLCARLKVPLRTKNGAVFGFELGVGSDVLLALSLIGCGMLGALVTFYRVNRSLLDMHLSPYITGASVGFVCYLLLKGGRHLFLTDSSTDIFAANPFSAGFVALIAGLFTEKFFHLLDGLAEDIKARIQKILKGETPEKGAG